MRAIVIMEGHMYDFTCVGDMHVGGRKILMSMSGESLACGAVCDDGCTLHCKDILRKCSLDFGRLCNTIAH